MESFFSVYCSGGGWLYAYMGLDYYRNYRISSGAALGFYFARQAMMKYLKENPPINEQMIRMMMAQMGRTPSEKQVRQMMAQMNKFQK